MTKLEETNEMIKAASRLYSVPMESDAIINKNDVQAITLLDIAKSLAIIADGITTQNEHIEKIENDLDRLEHSYSSKWYQVPSRH